MSQSWESVSESVSLLRYPYTEYLAQRCSLIRQLSQLRRTLVIAQSKSRVKCARESFIRGGWQSEVILDSLRDSVGYKILPCLNNLDLLCTRCTLLNCICMDPHGFCALDTPPLLRVVPGAAILFCMVYCVPHAWAGD